MGEVALVGPTKKAAKRVLQNLAQWDPSITETNDNLKLVAALKAVGVATVKLEHFREWKTKIEQHEIVEEDI
eukprot:8454488-Karenia_brevis.AAC.1